MEPARSYLTPTGRSARRPAAGFRLVLTALIVGALAPALAASAQDEANGRPTEGAATPEGAAERMLAAVKQRDLDTATALVQPRLRAEWRPRGEATMAALTVESFEVQDVTRQGRQARVRYRVTARFNQATYVEQALARARREMEQQELPEERIELALAALAAQVEGQARDTARRFAASELDMQLVREPEDGRWYVVEFASPAAEDDAGVSPRGTAQAVLRMWRQPALNSNRIFEMFSPTIRQSFVMADGWALIGALRVHEFEVGEARVDGDSAVVPVQWRATLDAERYKAELLQVMQRDFLERGIEGEELEEYLEQAGEQLTRDADDVRSAFERRTHEMRLVRHDGRWYVEQLISDTTPDGAGNAADAAEGLMDALSWDDVRQARFLIDPTRRNALVSLDGMTWIGSIQIRRHEVGEVTVTEDDIEAATVRVRWQASFNEEEYLRAARNAHVERLQAEGLDAEAIERRLEQTREARQDAAAQYAALAAGEAITLHLVRRGGRWYVARLTTDA